MRQGLSVSHMVALIPEAKPSSIRVLASIARKDMGIEHGKSGAAYIAYMPPQVRAQLDAAAEERGLPPNVLAGLLLEAVVQGNLFDAVLDDWRYTRKRA